MIKKIFSNIIQNKSDYKFKINKQLIKIFFKNKITLLDAGSAGGIHNRFKYIKEILTTILVDPNDKDQNNPNLITTGLWSKKTKLNFNITKNGVSSSIFKPNYKFLNYFSNKDQHLVMKRKIILSEKLDSVIKNKKIDIIKLDCEGAELEILKGARKTIKNTICLEVEVQFHKRYVNSPLFSEILNFLNKNKFDLYILNQESWKKNKLKFNSLSNYQIVWADTVFFLNQDHFLHKIKKFRYHILLKEISKYVIFLIIYKLYDDAFSFLKKVKNKNILKNKDIQHLNNLIFDNMKTNFSLVLSSLTYLVFSILLIPIYFFIYDVRIIKFFRKNLSKFLDLLSKFFRLSKNDIIDNENRL